MKGTTESKILSIQKAKERLAKNRDCLKDGNISNDLRGHITREIKDDTALLSALKLELADEIVDGVEGSMSDSFKNRKVDTVAGYAARLNVALEPHQAIRIENRARELSKRNHYPIGRTVDRGNGTEGVYCEEALGDAFYFALREGDERWEEVMKGISR